jgi:hypothetical protein
VADVGEKERWEGDEAVRLPKIGNLEDGKRTQNKSKI